MNSNSLSETNVTVEIRNSQTITYNVTVVVLKEIPGETAQFSAMRLLVLLLNEAILGTVPQTTAH